MEWIKQKFSVIGMARSGLAAAEKIQNAGGSVFLSDSKNETDVPDSKSIKEKYPCEFSGNTDRVLEADIIILSPGVPQTVPIVQKAFEMKIPVISEIEFAFRIMNPESKIIAVSGSNGKSTTVSLIHHLLTVAGFKTLLAGNIGDAFSSFDIENKYDWIVLELSSFQLELIDKFKANIAILMNITPDHLNRYKSFDDYAIAKFNLFKNHTKHEKAILFADDPVIKKFIHLVNSSINYFSLTDPANAYLQGTHLLLQDDSTFNLKTSQLPVSGPHNHCNVMAAILAVKDIINNNDILVKGLMNFKSLEHRLEFVDSIHGIQFINDSKATNTDSVKYALLSFPTPIRIIMGGSDKGEDFSVLNDLLKLHAKKIYLIGATKEKMLKAFQNVVDLECFDSLENAVNQAYKDSENGDYIVLSPACASYDMFKNFEHRGQVFKDIVGKISN